MQPAPAGKQCPACRSIIDPAASVCPFCQHRFGLQVGQIAVAGIVLLAAVVAVWLIVSNVWLR